MQKLIGIHDNTRENIVTVNLVPADSDTFRIHQLLNGFQIVSLLAKHFSYNFLNFMQSLSSEVLAIYLCFFQLCYLNLFVNGLLLIFHAF